MRSMPCSTIGIRRPDRSPRPAPDALPGDRRSEPPRRRPSGRADAGTALGCPSSINPASSAGAAASPRDSRAAPRRAAATARRRSARLPPRAAGCRVSRGSAWTRCTKLCSIRLATGARREARNHPRAAPAVNPRGSSSKRQRVAAGLGDDPVAHPLVQPPRQLPTPAAAGIAVPQARRPRAPADRRAHRITRVADGEHHRNPLRQQPARNERERLRRDPIQPLRRRRPGRRAARLGRLGQQAQDRQPDQKAIRRRAVAQPERHTQRIPLRTGQADPADPASARTTDAARRTRAPSPTRRPQPGRYDTRTPARPRTPTGPSCRPPPRRARPAPSSDPPGRVAAADPALRAR